jgi:tricorn protease
MNTVLKMALGAGLALTSVASAQVRPDAGMFRYPDISATQIVFAYAGDLWVVERDGGEATKLTSPRGNEVLPRFSPDGSQVAFLGNYEGNMDLYTIPVEGGLAERVTYHPSVEVLCDWTADDQLIFFQNGLAGLGRQTELYTVSVDGGMPEKLPVPYGAVGAISPDGQWLAYTPHTRDNRTWKRYQGGMATDIWLFNLEDYSAKKITDFEGTDTVPMWHGSRLYYLSDNGPSHRLNIWVYDPQDGSHSQVTTFDDYDVKLPAIGPGVRGEGEIVFQHGPDINVLRLDNETIRTVKISIPGDYPDLRTRRVDASKWMTNGGISPEGKRAIASARGDIWTLPAENGSPRNLTNTNGAFERSPAWSPDGRWIAYFSDANGEYEMYIRQSDGKGEVRQLTDFGGQGIPTYFFNIFWSPDSEKVLFSDKAANLWMVELGGGDEDEDEVETGIPEATLITRDVWGNQFNVNWSHDSGWLTYAKQLEAGMTSAIYVYDMEAGEEHQVTAGYFADSDPVFDRKGKWLFFSSSRSFAPTYSDLGLDFVYTGSGVLLAVPLKADTAYPWLPESDEVEWKSPDEDKADKDEDGDADESADDAEDKADGAEDEADDGGDQAGDHTSDDATETPWVDDGLTGLWEGSVSGPDFPPGGLPFSIDISYSEADGGVSGSVTSPMGTASIANGSFDKASGTLTFTISIESTTVAWEVQVKGDSMSGTASAEGDSFNIEAKRTRAGPASDGEEGGADDEAVENVEIDLEGFEARAFRIPVTNGQFRNLAVNDKNQLLYVRSMTGSNSGSSNVMVFDLTADDKSEKSVASGAAGFRISADGKKILIPRGNNAAIQNASAGASSKNVVTSGMFVRIDPRTEWKQILRDAWRRHRDFFYVENLHGVDWDAVYERYAKMLDAASSRSDVSFIIGEMIGELNIGHAYYWGGDIPRAPSVSVGMLGVDFEIASDDEGNSGYRFARIVEGGAWDEQDRGPLSKPGVDANEGDFLLAVNGSPVSTQQSPYEPFQGLAGQVTTLTLSANAVLGDDDDRDVLIKPIGGEGGLRYRAWVEGKRKYVEEKSDGQIAYIYVPNTGVQGQNELIRGFYGQLGMAAMLIDERWNGGGQIPNRFIELLNRPRTNYWARRDGKDWPWPPDSHQGPKAMLINGLAGSGGDMFPSLFRQAGVGKIIGMRTWGGLVGISGVPGLIDGGYTAVPTFGYYETNGTWGIEGYGVDPDIEVIDDPSKMVDGGDPQLDAAIEYLLGEIRDHPYVPGVRPADPDRSGMGVREEDK